MKPIQQVTVPGAGFEPAAERKTTGSSVTNPPCVAADTSENARKKTKNPARGPNHLPKRIDLRRVAPAIAMRWVERPASEQIATELNTSRAIACQCANGRSPCPLRCGVERVGGKWRAMEQMRRVEWLRLFEVGP